MHPRRARRGRGVRRGLGLTLALGALVGAAFVSITLAMEPTKMTVGAMGPGTTWYVYGAALSELLKPALPAGSRVDVLPHAGGVGNPRLVADRKADFAFSFSLTNQWAFRGKQAYDRKLDVLRGVAGGLDFVTVTVLVRSDSGITSLETLKERRGTVRLGTLPAGSMGEYAARNLLDVLGITYDDIRRAGGAITHTGWPAIAAAVKDGRINTVIGITTRGHSGVTEIALQNDVRFLPLPTAVVAVMREQFSYEPSTLTAGTFRGIGRDLPTVGFSTVFITHKDIPDGIVYVVTKAWAENKAALTAAHKGLAEFEPSAAWRPELVGLPLHPGAERYYRERKWMK